MLLDDLAGDREAKTGSTIEPATGGVGATEAFEDHTSLILGDALTVVIDLDDDLPADARDVERDDALGVATGIVEQIADDSLELVATAANLSRGHTADVES